MKVTVRETSMIMIRPAECRPRHSLWLSNLDLLQLRNHVTTIYAYNKPTTAGTSALSFEFFDIKVLKDALSKALVPFYPVAGRLGRDANGRLELDCNGEGVLLLEAETETALAELGEFIPVPDGREFSPGPEVQLTELVPRVDYSKGVSSYPLLILQVTRFKCGGVCLGIGIHHTIADGESSLSFINTWADMARGLPLTATLFWDRTILRAQQPATPKFHHTEYDPHPTMMIANNSEQRAPKPATVGILKITPEQLNTLKIRANSRYSTYEILTAHIWRCASKARGFVDEQPTKLQISVDGRSRLNPPIPAGYFGNVIFHTTPVAPVGELISEPLAQTVERIRQAISRMNNEYLRSAIDYLEDPSSPEGIIRVPGHCRSPNLKVVSWMRLPFKSADFGWGSSILFRKADISEGTGLILPRNPDGTLSLAICLEADVMEPFKKLLYDSAGP
ncbi:unnamed protein product [Linum tenue]|uniref:Uncharacterized protein n=1 Tax=Linum tenue TaxID=586396 RepID=A0AAV0IAE6_9ROSI|nr:unnamed protein product [Linum tenue]